MTVENRKAMSELVSRPLSQGDSFHCEVCGVEKPANFFKQKYGIRQIWICDACFSILKSGARWGDLSDERGTGK